MPEPDWHLLVTLTNALRVIAWAFPLALLTVLAYYIERYTKFKTKWHLVAIAAILAVGKPIFALYQSHPTVHTLYLHEAILDTILLIGVGLATYASLNLLKFQKIEIGKTKDIVEVLATLGVTIPTLAYLGGRINTIEAWGILMQNTSTVLLVPIFLIIGKIIRSYVPRYSKLIYTITVLAAILLPLNMLLRDYAQLAQTEENYRNFIILVGVVLQSIGNIMLAIPAAILIMEARIRGIHIIPLEEKRTDAQPLRYRLKKGFSYIVSDASGEKGFEIFKEHIAHKHHGLGIIRTKPDRIRSEYGLRTTPLLWMTTIETEHKSITPNELERLLLIIKDFIGHDGDSILLLERLDYLISENGFEKTLTFIHQLNDMIVSSECILAISMDLNTLTTEQKHILLQELEDLSEADKTVLNEPLYELLEFIYNENSSGKRPSFKRITDKFNITKTTARKRIQELEGKRLVRVIEDGKFKLLEATEGGSRMIKSPVGPRGV
ncbi:MAG: DUF835 domain-containing protein [Candidatus Altiarchaeota archaeon]|nr:DUF835 domain-containing protein [Candidatus Altiarchaeota archaeon]